MLHDFISSPGFMPQGHCYLWEPGLVWTMVITDSLIGLSYAFIAISLYLLVRRIRIPFSKTFLAFGFFIAACGLTHLMDVWTLWIPSYWPAAFLKVVTTVASVSTALLLIPLRRKVGDYSESIRAVSKQQAEIKKERDFSKTLIENSMDGIFAFDESLKFTAWNKTMEELTGFPLPTVLGRVATDVFPHIKSSDTLEMYKRVLQGEKFHIVEQEFTYLTTKEKGFFEANWSPLISDKKVTGGLCIIRDITQRKQNEAEVDRFFNLSLDLLLIAGTDGFFKKVNPSFERILGFSSSELLNKPFIEFIHPDDREATIAEVVALSQGKTTILFENRYSCIDGSYRTISWRAVPLGNVIYASGRDVSEQRKTEALVREQQNILVNSSRLASLGEMAGGVAHEINTPLAIITMNLDLSKELIAQDEIDRSKLTKSILVIEKTTDRIAKIVSGLRFFSKDGKDDPFSKVDVATIVDETLALCSEKFRNHGIDLDCSKIPKDLFVECRPVQISQVLLNLLNNSHDAIEGLQVKWIKLEVFDLGDTVKIILSDSGQGIDSQIRDKIMQPFFTTKEIGKGTGLGLSIARGIVESHCGSFILNPHAPYTTFELVLPKIQSLEKEKSTV